MVQWDEMQVFLECHPKPIASECLDQSGVLWDVLLALWLVLFVSATTGLQKSNILPAR
jgi:hypothetical protein